MRYTCPLTPLSPHFPDTTAWWEPYFEVVDDPLPSAPAPDLLTARAATTYLAARLSLPLRFLISLFLAFRAIWLPPYPQPQSQPQHAPRTAIEEWVAVSAIPAARAANIRAQRTRHAIRREMETKAIKQSQGPRTPCKGPVAKESLSAISVSPPSSTAAHIPLMEQVFRRGHVECFVAALWFLVLWERVRIAYTTPCADDDRVREHLVLPAVPALAAREAWMVALDLVFDALLVGWVFRGLMAAWADQDGAVYRFQARMKRERERENAEMESAETRVETPHRVPRRMPRRST